MTSNNITIAIGADHRGYSLKEKIKKELDVAGATIQWIDVGTHAETRTDYPIYAVAAVEKIKAGEAALGLLICGSGVGMAVAANRYPGIYAALVWNKEVARVAKQDDHTNVLVLPSDFVTPDTALSMVHAWLSATPKEGRYAKRIAMIDAIEVN